MRRDVSTPRASSYAGLGSLTPAPHSWAKGETDIINWRGRSDGASACVRACKYACKLFSRPYPLLFHSTDHETHPVALCSLRASTCDTALAASFLDAYVARSLRNLGNGQTS
jgi:hypothetical protein